MIIPLKERMSINELDKKLREKIFAFAYRVEPYRTKLSRDRDMVFVVN